MRDILDLGNAGIRGTREMKENREMRETREMQGAIDLRELEK